MRPLIRRLLSAVALGLGVWAVLFALPSVVGIVLLFVLALAGMGEFYLLLNLAGVPAFRLLGAGAGFALLTATYLAMTAVLFLPPNLAIPLTGDEIQAAALFVIVFAICLRQFPQKNNPQPLPTISCTLFGIMYVPFLLSYLLLLVLAWEPVSPGARLATPAAMRLLYLLVVVKMSDVGAFLFGSLFGRHKLFPRISPGKTWEGLAGGLLVGLGTSLAFFELTSGGFGPLPLRRTDAWILGILLAGVGVLGDLVESLIKRAAGVKESGRLFPGLGGILDVLDSLLFSGPLLYYYLRWVVMPR